MGCAATLVISAALAGSFALRGLDRANADFVLERIVVRRCVLMKQHGVSWYLRSWRAAVRELSGKRA